MRTLSLPLAILLLTLLGGCTGRGGAKPTAGQGLAAHAETDFATASDEAYAAAAASLAASIDRELSDLPGARGYGPRDVLPLRDGHLLVAVEPAADAELLVLAVESGGSLRWTQDIPLAPGTLVTGVELVERSGAQLLRLGLSGGVADALWLHPAPVGPIALRASQGRSVVNAAFRAANPRVPTSPGTLGGEDVLAQLAATMHLAGADQAAARGKPAVLGHLRAMAGSTDTWLAQAAADLLTLPVQ